MKHTPGPWELDNADGTIRSKQFQSSDQMGDYRGCIVCDMAAGLGTRWGHPARRHALPETLANALLIAAAPELLEALEVARGVILGEWGPDCTDTVVEEQMKQIEAAICKAKGEL